MWMLWLVVLALFMCPWRALILVPAIPVGAAYLYSLGVLSGELTFVLVTVSVATMVSLAWQVATLWTTPSPKGDGYLGFAKVRND